MKKTNIINPDIKYFKINRSSLLKQILINKGWKEADENSIAEFSYWDTYKNNINKTKIMVMPRKITNKLDNKKTMYTLLTAHNLTKFLPPTYIDLKNIDSNIFNKNKVLFLKAVGVSGKRGIHPVKSFDQMNTIIGEKYSNYILQEQIPNILLQDGHTTTLRAYVLFTSNKEIFVHKNIVEIRDNNKYYSLKDTQHYHLFFGKIKDICFLSIRPFIRETEIDSNNYIIFGFDFMLNKDYDPFLTEIVQYPNLSGGEKTQQTVITTMLSDFYDLYVDPIITNKQSIQGEWILCNPLFDTGISQIHLTNELKNNLYKNVSDYDFTKNNSKVISTNYRSKNSYILNSSINYLNKQCVLMLANRINCYNFMKKYEILDLSPKTYLKLEYIEHNNNNNDENNNNIYYLKTVNSCAKKGVFIGTKTYLKSIIDDIKDKYIIQDAVKDQLIFKNKKIVYGFYFYILNNEILYSTDYKYISTNTEKNIENKHRVETEHDTFLFSEIDNYKLISKNINKCVKQFLTCYATELYNYKLDRQFSLNRFDIMINKNCIPKILEVNSVEVAFRRESRIFPEICKFLANKCEHSFFNLPDESKDIIRIPIKNNYSTSLN